MVSPLSGNLAELCIQKLENDHIIQYLDINEISNYERYIDDIIIIYNKDRIKEEKILHAMNDVDGNLTFKLTSGNNKTINFLDLIICRKQTNMELGIYIYIYIYI